MSSLNQIRLPDGTMLNAAEWLHWPFYSTMEIAAGDPINLLAFNYTVSQPISRTPSIANRVASENDTNVNRPHTMGQDEAMVVFAITYEIQSTTTVSVGTPAGVAAPVPVALATDIRRLQRDCIVELMVMSGRKKPEVGVPFSYIPQALGAEAYTSGDAGAPAMNIHYGTGGEISPRSQRMLNLPVYIGGFGEHAVPGNKMFFALRFRAPGGAPAGLLSNMWIRWWLDGLKKRPA